MVNYYINNPLILYYVVFYSRFLLQFLMRVRNPFFECIYFKKKRRRKKSGVMYYTATFKLCLWIKKSLWCRKLCSPFKQTSALIVWWRDWGRPEGDPTLSLLFWQFAQLHSPAVSTFLISHWLKYFSLRPDSLHPSFISSFPIFSHL